MMLRDEGREVTYAAEVQLRWALVLVLVLLLVTPSLLFLPCSLALAWELKDSECLVWKYETQQRC